jgi:hypothetical protein
MRIPFLRGRDQEGLFDGHILGDRIAAFLARTNVALERVADVLPAFEVDSIEVALTIDAGMNVSFAGIGGNLDRTRTFTFTLKPKCPPKTSSRSSSSS